MAKLGFKTQLPSLEQWVFRHRPRGASPPYVQLAISGLAFASNHSSPPAHDWSTAVAIELEWWERSAREAPVAAAAWQRLNQLHDDERTKVHKIHQLIGEVRGLRSEAADLTRSAVLAGMDCPEWPEPMGWLLPPRPPAPGLLEAFFVCLLEQRFLRTADGSFLSVGYNAVEMALAKNGPKVRTLLSRLCACSEFLSVDLQSRHVDDDYPARALQVRLSTSRPAVEPLVAYYMKYFDI